MRRSLVEYVWRRARGRCEYCRMPQEFDDLSFEIDHIIAEQHGGKSIPSNLALACFADNHHKGPNLGGIDPLTGKRAWLFDPRRQKWQEHFRWQGADLLGVTPTGRVTVAVLAVNLPYRVRHRAQLIKEGVFPPALME